MVVGVLLDSYVPAAARFVGKEQAVEVEVHRGHHRQREDDQRDHRQGHSGAEAVLERVSDSRLDCWENRPESAADARDQGEDDVRVVDQDVRGGRDHRDAAQEEHLDVTA